MLPAPDENTLLLLIVVAAFLTGGGSAYVCLNAADRSRLHRIESQLDHIIQHMGIDFHDPASPAGLSDEVRRLAEEGMKIAAVRRHREQTGVGLLEAKQAIDAHLALAGTAR